LTVMFACPICGGNLEELPENLHCVECNETFGTKDGIFNFIRSISNHGEFDRQKMRHILEHAKQHGWRSTLRDVMEPERPQVADLLDSEVRSLSLSPLAPTQGAVLDFGCGYGGVSLALAKLYADVVSLDGSFERVSFLNIVRRQEKIENIQPVCHIDPLRLPFPDNAFDAIVMVGVYEYLPLNLPEMTTLKAHRAALLSLRRIMKPGGKLLMYSKNRYGWNYLLGGRDHNGIRFGPALPLRLADLLHRFKNGSPYRIVNYSVRQYRRMFLDAGFDVSGLYWPFPGYQVPRYLFNLNGSAGQQIGSAKLFDGWNAAAKQKAIVTLEAAGLLPRFVPTIGMMAIKLGAE